MNRHRFLLALFVLAAAPGRAPSAQDLGQRQSDGISREQMWAAPTTEDWAKPCLIRWQRNWDDALEVAEATGKPILVCVNMDGEIASEHYAGVRYRQPEIVELYAPYVTVVASVYRHNPVDHDREGRRIECPRFGTVTCGEHIAIEPILYEKYFDGERVAPRHVMIELDQAETYDVYYAFDTASVFETIRKGIVEREFQPPADTRGDRPLLELVDSGDSADQEVVERAYLEGDRQQRIALLRKAVEAKDRASVDLLRLAIFGFDVELARLGRQGLAETSSVGAIDLINEALRVPMEDAEKEALIAALDRLGESSPRAKTLAVVHRGLEETSRTVDLEEWSTSLEGVEAPHAVARRELEVRLDANAAASRSREEDAAARLAFAESSLALAVDPETAVILAADKKTGQAYGELLFEDALSSALVAEELGAKGWRVDASIALASHYLGDAETAYARAEIAAGAMPSGAYDWNAMAVLALFAQSRERAIKDAVMNKTEWPPEWLTDVDAAYSVLARHPLGTDHQVASHFDFLVWLGAFRQAGAALDRGLERFPDSWALHGRLRSRILASRGVEALESTYESLLLEKDAAPNLSWHAGYTSLVAAEFHRRANASDKAWDAYGRAIGHYEESALQRPEGKDECDHYVAMAHAGRARMALDRDDPRAALDEVLASFRRRASSAASLDGLNVNAVGTANLLLVRLEGAGETELAARLRAALDALDPALRELPEFERGGPRRGSRRGQ